MLRYTLKQLSYFVTAAETKSIADAAAAENVSQPSVSSALGKLEDSLGVDLFIRHHAQGVTLTPIGQRLLPVARDLIRHAAEFQHMATSAATEPVGQLKIGCYPMLAAVYMPSIISEFTKRYPRVSVTFLEGTEDVLLPKLKEGEIEHALVFGAGVPETVKCVTIETCYPYVVMSPRHRLAKRKKLSLEELVDEPMILLNSPSGRHYYLSLFSDRGLTPNIAHMPSSFEVVRGLVARGLGYSILTTRLREHLTYDGLRLACRPLRYSVRPVPVYLIRMPTQRISRLGALFQDVCQAVGRARARELNSLSL